MRGYARSACACRILRLLFGEVDRGQLRWRRRQSCGRVVAALHRRWHGAASKDSDQSSRSAGGFCALAGTRNRVRSLADDECHPGSVRLQIVWMCLVHLYHHSGGGRSRAVQSQSYASNPVVVHRKLLLFRIRQCVGQIKNHPVRTGCHCHAGSGSEGCAQRDFYTQVVGGITHHPEITHRQCAWTCALRSGRRCQQDKNPELYSRPHC